MEHEKNYQRLDKITQKLIASSWKYTAKYRKLVWYILNKDRDKLKKTPPYKDWYNAYLRFHNILDYVEDCVALWTPCEITPKEITEKYAGSVKNIL